MIAAVVVAAVWPGFSPTTSFGQSGAGAAAEISLDVTFPYGAPPIDYFGAETDDPVARLMRRLDAGETRLDRDPQFGYLPGVLEALGISTRSQVLVFSKSSANVRLISPKTPRAIYFNDDVYVGWIPEISALEISAVDPHKGGIFYSLPQADGKPQFRREESCLLCHASSGSLKVPGHLLRSFTTDLNGQMLSGYSRISHDTPFANRWGGWYVTGTHGTLSHMGNLVGEEAVQRHQREPAFGGNITDLAPFFDLSRYPSPHSDIVALMLLDHQVQLHNLLARYHYESRLGRSETVLEALVRYLLFVEAAPLEGPVRGTSGFAEWFQKQGPQDRQGRSLRQLDLKTRLPKYRLSYLIYSRAFDGLPAEAKARLYRRLREVLSGKDESPAFDAIPADERRAILEIVRETKDDLPDEWATRNEDQEP